MARPCHHHNHLAATLVVLLLLFLVSLARGEQECDRLKQSLTYTQEEAPRDLSGVLPVVVERVNLVLDGVVDVEVEWHGDDLHGRVGEHLVKCKVTRLASALLVANKDQREALETQVETDDMGRRVVSQCFHLPFTILDTNECTLPMGHAMRHHCHSSAICVNTIGSYECLCARLDDKNEESSPSSTVDNDDFWAELEKPPRSSWEVSFNTTSRTTCPSMPSTRGCCPERVHSKEGASCRKAFRCPIDPCASKTTGNGNDCTTASTCVRKEFPVEELNYVCQCPAGLMGNGHKCKPGIDPKPNPKVMFDGVTPTEETIKNNYYCGCTVPVVDACSGYPPCKGKHEICTVSAQNQPYCACKTHYVMHEKYGCVDESPPIMKLNHDVNGDSILRLKQGDVYKEYAVDIQDENAEAYLRSLKIAYSRPLPNGCLTQVGEFHVNYTIATPWTSPPYVRLTRRVIIDDFDECQLVEGKNNNNHRLSPAAASYEKTCPELVPRCSYEAGAVCVNTIGSYTCKCPKYTTGDGFQSGLSFGQDDHDDRNEKVVPTGYDGGTGCHDTSTPIISLLGPNPKILRVCECSGIKGILGGNKKDEKDLILKQQQQKDYGIDIKSMIDNTRGAELCATHDNPNPSSSDCVDAFDETYKGKVDLSRKVSVGAPVQKSPLHWAVPYNVQDEAGNKAPTVWRDIIVEEVDLGDVEARVRREALKGRDAEIKRAVDKALEAERRERKQAPAVATPDCPKCRKCDCTAVDGSVDMEAACDGICNRRAPTCPAINGQQQVVDQDSLVLLALLWLERFFPPSAVPIILFVMVVFGIISILRWVLSLLFYQRSYRPSDYSRYTGREGALRNQVTVYQNGIPSSSHTPANGARHQGAGAFSAPPRASTSLGGSDGSLFTPSPSRYAPGPTGVTDHVGMSASGIADGRGGGGGDMDIYANSPIITPSRTGDGVHRRRTPYTS